MPIGQFSGAVCKMYVRRRSKLKRLCTQARKLTPIIISDLRRYVHTYMYVCSRYSVYFQIEAIGGDVVCPSDRLPLHVLIRESFCWGRSDDARVHTHTHTETRSLGVCVLYTRRSSPLCTKLDPLSWNGQVPLLSSCSFIMIEVCRYFQICSHAWLRWH